MKLKFNQGHNHLTFLFIAIVVAVCTYGQGYLTKAVEWVDSLGLRSILLISFVGIVGLVVYGFYIWNKVERSWLLNAIVAILALLCVDCLWLHGMTHSCSVWLLLVLSIVFALINLCTRVKGTGGSKTQDGQLVLERDTPTDHIEERRKSIARTIIEAIRIDAVCNQNIDGSYVINIDGVYGSGKSSLMKYIKQDVLGEDDVVMDFYPWRYPSNEKIIENFFSALSSALSKYFCTKIEKLLKQYVDAVIKDYGGKSGIDNLVTEVVRTDRDSNALFKEIKEKLCTLQRPIYIFLDDLYRLKSDEIWTVCYLIRDMANFPYLYFILASDMDYVELMLGKSLSSKEEARTYLKKIINLNIPLLPANRDRVYSMLLDGIEQALKDKGIDSEVTAKTLGNIQKSSVAKELKKNFSDYREVKRFLSSLRFSLSAYPTKDFKENINIVDFIWLELLKYKSPFIHKQLCTNCLQMLNVSKDRYTLKEEVKTYINKKAQAEFEDVIARQQADENGEIYQKEIQNINEVFDTQKSINEDLVYRILVDLFYDTNNYREQNSTQYINSFDNYFYLEISEKNLSMSEFLEIIQSPENTYCERIERDVLDKEKEESFYHNFSVLVQQSPNALEGNVTWWLQRLFYCVNTDAQRSESHQELLCEHSKISIILERNLISTLFPFLSSHIFRVADIEQVIAFMKDGSEYLSCKLFMLNLAYRTLGHEYSYFKQEELEPVCELIFKNVTTYIENTPEAYYNYDVQDIIKDCRSINSQQWGKIFQDYFSRNTGQVKYWALGVLTWYKEQQRFLLDDIFIGTVIGSKSRIAEYLEILAQYDNAILPLQKIFAENRIASGKSLVNECPLLKQARYYDEDT